MQSKMLQKIEKETMALSSQEKLQLLEYIIFQLKIESFVKINKKTRVVNCYGLGKNLWEIDAQTYVSNLRKPRI